MHPLNRKLIRDLWRLRGQVIALALVVASGVAVLVMSLSTQEALRETAAAYYERYRFADVFATVKRAPERLIGRIEDIPGVQAVGARIKEFAVLDIRGFDEPVIGRLVSIPERDGAVLNRLVMRAGRRVALGAPDEAVISEPLAEAHGLTVGDELSAIINGRKRTLRIVGVALSPEFVYPVAPGGLMPDEKRFGILWMGRAALASAYNLKGAFNDLSVRITRGTPSADVIQRLDRILAPYGSTGAIDRADQISNWFLMNEIEQLGTMSRIMPTIFLAVAAFLAYMVLARLIALERGEIGLLKAFGYSNWAVGWHYAKMVIAMTAIGIVIGWIVGSWFGSFITRLYAELFRFPFLYYRPGPAAFATGALISLAATLLGAAGAVRRAVALPPAEAMRPPAPPVYHRARLGRGRLAAWFDQPTRIILRQILRWPGRAALTAAGIGMAVGLVVSSLQWIDAINHIVDVYFLQAQRQDMTISFNEARSSSVVRDVGRLPGVLQSEPHRAVAVRFRVGNKVHRGAITGVQPDARLSPIYDSAGRDVAVPATGLVLSRTLAKKLGVSRGAFVTVEVLEARRPVRQVRVVSLFDTYIGMPAYMHAEALRRLMRERATANAVHIVVDPAMTRTLFRRLKETPAVTAVTIVRAAVEVFHETMGETLMIYVSMFILFACTLAFGVAYNSVRIALSERGRELATLRVIGFTRFEISYILLGEVAVVVFVAMPIGCLMGLGLTWFIAGSFETELFRVPVVIYATTYGKAVLIGLAASAASAALVRRRVDRLDLIAVLKTRE